MNEILQNCFVILASLGSSGAIIFGLSSWLGKIWAERLMAKEKEKLQEKLTHLVKQFERKNYVSKVRFDTEFTIYRELLAMIDKMVRSVYMLFPTGIDHLPVEEAKQNEVFRQRYEQAHSDYIIARQSVSKNSAFISKENYDMFEEVMEKCRLQVVFFPYYLRSDSLKLDWEHEQECWKRTSEIQDNYTKLQEKLREYLRSLDVLE